MYIIININLNDIYYASRKRMGQQALMNMPIVSIAYMHISKYLIVIIWI